MLRRYTPEEFLAAAQVGTVWWIAWHDYLPRRGSLFRVTRVRGEEVIYVYYHYLEGAQPTTTCRAREFCNFWLAPREESDWLLATLTGEVSHVHVS